MQAKTEELLYLLMWTCETFSRPTWRKMTESFEGWAYRRGLLRQLHRLERKQFIESQGATPADRVHRLTEEGRLRALGGREPEACWKRRWDGQWRLVLFDVPEARSTARDKLRRYLRSRGFGYLQNSVWITPDPLADERTILAGGPVNVESLILLEARPCAGESDAEIVSGAWDFVAINQCFARYQAILAQRPKGRLETAAAAKAFHRWLRDEHSAWLEAMALDPLLPACLLPEGYRGQQAWRTRLEVMADAADQMRNFKAAA